MAATARAAAKPRARVADPTPRPARTHGAASELRPRARQAPVARPAVAGGVAWIGVVAALLGGIVALNVAVLRLNMTAERLDERREKLVAANAALLAEHATLASTDRIEAIAKERLGLVVPAETSYVEIRTRAR